jgi:hypothetical protein
VFKCSSSKDWLVLNQDNVSKCSSNKVQLSMLV